MKQNILLQKITNEQHLPWLGAILGMLVAAWMIFQAHGLINSDGILYLEMARLFDVGEWRKGFALFNWPLYPLLIAAMHKISGLGLQTSAHALTILFFALTSAGVITLVREAGGDRRVMLAAGLLLFSSPYLVGSVLSLVVRDHGFWASHVWSIVFFLRFYRSNAWKDAWLWGAVAAMAMLFRIEGITYLVMLPLVLLLQPQVDWRQRFATLVKAHALLLTAAAGLLAAFVLNPALSLKSLGRLQDPLVFAKQAYHQVTQGLASRAYSCADSMLGPFLDDWAVPGLLLTLALVLLTKAASSAGWLQLAFAIYLRKRQGNFALPKHSSIPGWLLLLGLANGLIIILSVSVLSKRYMVPVGIIILVYAAFGLVALFDAWKRKPSRPIARNWIFPAAGVAIALQAGLLLWPSNSGNSFEQDAVRWALTHTPPHSRIYYDTGRLRYFATGETFDRGEADWATIQALVSSGRIRQYDYLLVHVSSKRPEQEQFITAQLGTQPLAVFDNNHGKKVLIYRVLR